MPSFAPPEAKENEQDGFVAQAPTNALMLKRLLSGEAGFDERGRHA
jgi:hypothetical protein